MHIRRWLSFFGVLALWAVCLSCGQNYRLPIIQIPGDPGDPGLYHFAMTISTNDPMINSNIPGSVMQTDVVGDSNAGEALVGRGPIFATLLPTGAANRIYVANGLEDTISTMTAAPQACSPGPVCPIGATSTITLPAGSTPTYLNSTEASNMYVILSGNHSVGVISVFQNILAQEIPLPGAGMLAAVVELPNGHKLYVADQTNGLVYVINTASRQIAQTLSVGAAPSMVLASPDSSAVYVMTNAGVSVVDALTDVVSGSLPTGSAPSAISYDTKLNRLYVAEATAGRVSVYDAAVAPPNVPSLLLATPAGSFPGAMGVTPLPDGSRFYVLGGVDSTNLTLTGVKSTTLAIGSPYLLSSTPQAPAATPLGYCANIRFRFMVGASADSGRVYVSSCDAGGQYIYRTSDETGVLFLSSPFQPPVAGTFKPQNPVFLITGR